MIINSGKKILMNHSGLVKRNKENNALKYRAAVSSQKERFKSEYLSLLKV